MTPNPDPEHETFAEFIRRHWRNPYTRDDLIVLAIGLVVGILIGSWIL